VPFFSTQHWKGKYLLSRIKIRK